MFLVLPKMDTRTRVRPGHAYGNPEPASEIGKAAVSESIENMLESERVQKQVEDEAASILICKVNDS